ncbi:IucA/IucC family protein [Catenuloplanes atrovinosus]|uniref:Siderophore synthetase component n=1 Tax=Catenuloplanes atrovinosus TaxID=137266 RepID=A0AAE3YP04_9ACTN|nr:IucA/IucC family protein [Catenuloplanes atrovinosus]MDR7275911.1 siderophore synthetase component [Catenuloplanes atrovinosus]
MTSAHTTAPDAAQTRDDLGRLRPDLVAAYDAALPGAHAAVLTRLWGAIAREPIPGLGARTPRGDRLTVTLPGGGTLDGSRAATAPFAQQAADLHGPDGTITDPVHLARITGMDARFRAELANSVANLALARADAHPTPTLKQLADDPEGLATAEQSVVDGHPIHPCCRTRIGLSTEEVLAYAPEHRTIVELAEIRVPDDRWYGEGPPILTVHPWQRDHVLDRHPELRPTGRTRPARPLMSLRTLAPVGRRSQHLKTAVDVQMTSAVRTVSPAAVRNGPIVSVLLHTLATDLSGLTILRETFAGAVLVDGEPSRSLAYLAREAPRQAPGEVILPLAALAQPALQQDAIDTGFAGDPEAFLARLAATVLPPLLVMLHRGAALEAHGQNTLVALRDGVPTRLLYRDLGGVRISPARLRDHDGFSLGVPTLHGDLGTDDPDQLRTKLLAAAISGTLAEQIAVLTRTHDIEPSRLWRHVAAAAHDTYARLGPGAAGDAARLLDAPLPLKATTAMRLAADPLDDVWTHLDNPMNGLR